MARLRAWVSRLIATVFRSNADPDLEAELESHLALHVDDLVRRGVDVRQARRLALLKLGGLEGPKEASRERRTLPLLETSLRDIRYAFRSARKNPAFVSIAVVNLALGIGVNTAVFSVVNTVLLQRPPYADPDGLVVVRERFPKIGESTLGAAQGEYVDYRDRNLAFSDIAGHEADVFDLTGATEPARITAQRATSHVVLNTGRLSADRTHVFRGRGRSRRRTSHRAELRLLAAPLWREQGRARTRVAAERTAVHGDRGDAVGIRVSARRRRCRRAAGGMGADGVHPRRDCGPSVRIPGSHRRAPQAGRVDRPGATGRRARRQRLPAGARRHLLRQSAPRGRCRATRRVERGPRPSRAAGADGCRRLRPAHCLRQRHQPAPRSRGGAPARDGDAQRARRQHRPPVRAVADREHDADRRRCVAGLSARFRTDSDSDHALALARGRSFHGTDRPVRACVHGRRLGGQRTGLRPGARHADCDRPRHPSPTR